MELTRRQMLAALLGAACTRLPRRGFEGAIAGANDALGHKLRAGFRPEVTAESRVPVLIAGGGVAGLSAGWRLLRAGFGDFRVVELDDAPGGTARMGENAVSRHPWGAHYLPCPLPHAKAALALLREMNVVDATGAFDEAQLCRSPQERLFNGDRWYDGLWPAAGASADDARQLEAFQREMRRWADARDARGRRAFAVPMAYGSDDAEVRALDRLSMAQWMEERGLTSRRLRWYVEYAMRDDFGARLEDVSAWAGVHYFASRQQEGRGAEFLTWPEGNGRLVAHLAGAIGKRLETGAAVLQLVRKPRGAEVLTSRGERIVAEQVVLALPRPFVARLLGGDKGYQPPMGAWLVANLTLRRAPQSRGFPQAWDSVLYGSPSLGYVDATHQLDPGGCVDARCTRRAPADGASVWTWYYPFTDTDASAGRARLLSLEWRDCADLAVADLRRAHPDLESCVTRLDAWRWGHAMPRPSPGLVFSQARLDAARPQGDVHFAHTDLSALPLFEEAQYHGVRAAEEILHKRGVRFESLL
ncbi:MAG: flavin monoamine oxidase family protein [Myxococcales bacterium]